MALSASFSSVVLPNEATAGDVISCRDRMAVRVHLLVPAMAAPAQKKKKKDEDEEPMLPEGLTPMKALPDKIESAWKRFDTAVTAHEKVRDDRATGLADQAHQAADEPEKAAANRESDDAWRAFERWTDSAASLRNDGREPSPAEARWLYAQVFPAPEGLQFIRRRPDVQWDEMKSRMRTLEGDRAKAVIDGFHGERHLAQLAASHERFGKAFGYSKLDQETPEVQTNTRPEAQVARDALRELVFKIEAHADPDDPTSELLAAFLLRPFERLVRSIEDARRAARKAEAVKGKKVEAAGKDKKPEPAPPTG